MKKIYKFVDLCLSHLNSTQSLGVGFRFFTLPLSSTKYKPMRLMKIYFSCMFALASMIAGAQSLSPQVLSTAGNTIQGQGGSLSWTLGETAVSRWVSADQKNVVTEGFHQPQLQVNFIGAQTEQWVQIVPNPVRERLNLAVVSTQQELYLANLIDAQGKVLIKDLKVAGKAEIDMSTYPAGIYFLSIRQSGESSVQNHKVVKL